MYKVQENRVIKYEAMKEIDTFNQKELFSKILSLYNDYGRIDHEYKLTLSNKEYITFSHPEIDSLNPVNTDLQFAENEYAKGLSKEEVQKSVQFRKEYREMTNQLKPGYIDTLWIVSEEEFINHQLNN